VDTFFGKCCEEFLALEVGMDHKMAAMTSEMTLLHAKIDRLTDAVGKNAHKEEVNLDISSSRASNIANAPLSERSPNSGMIENGPPGSVDASPGGQ
jgi:hypothetical protein